MQCTHAAQWNALKSDFSPVAAPRTHHSHSCWKLWFILHLGLRILHILWSHVWFSQTQCMIIPDPVHELFLTQCIIILYLVPSAFHHLTGLCSTGLKGVYASDSRCLSSSLYVSFDPCVIIHPVHDCHKSQAWSSLVSRKVKTDPLDDF
jgi:hypothetical protein